MLTGDHLFLGLKSQPHSRGRVVVAGATEELRGSGPLRYRVVVEEPAVLDDLPGAGVDRHDGDAVLLTITSGEPADLLAHLTSRTRVSEFHRHVEPLAHVFREATR